MGPGFVPTFLYYFVSTTLIGLLVLAQSGAAEGLVFTPYQIAIALGLLAGLLGAYFNSYQTITLPVPNRGVFTQKLNGILSAMGYQEASQLEEFAVYERGSFQKIFSGKLLVQIDKDKKEATIVGRSSRIRQIKQQLEN